MWKDLSIKEKAALINIGVKNGLYDLEDIKSSYNKYANGGHLDDDEIVLPAVNLGEVKIPIVEGTDEVDTPIVMPKPKDTYSPVPLTKKTQMEVFGLNKPYNSLHRDEAQRVGDFYRDDYRYRLQKEGISNLPTQNEINEAFNNVAINVGSSKDFRDPGVGGTYNSFENSIIMNDYIENNNMNREANLAHELSHALDSTFGLSFNNESKEKLRKAYGTLNISGDKRANLNKERRAVNTSLRETISRSTNKTKEALDDYINSMNLEDMQNHINSLKSNYIRGSDVNEQDLDSIKEALKTVAYSPMNENSYFTNYAKFGGLLNTEANKYETGGYKPSSRIKKQITKWEGSTMKVNRSFEDEARDFNYSLPKGATSKLSQSQLDGLYSYSYNVGAGRFRQRVKPVLTKYLNGEATIQDVQKSMWASKDSQLRGLAKRRNVERSMFGGNYQSPLRDNLVTQNLIQSLPSVYDYRPPIIPQIEYTPDPSIIDNLTEEYTGIPEIMDRPVEVNPADNFLKVYNLLNNIRR
jgi:hypothetical protein